MATAKVKFRVSSVNSKEGTLYYQVIHDRMARQIGTGYRLHESEWDARASKAIIPSDMGDGRYQYLTLLNSRIHEDMARLRRIATRYDKTGKTYTADRIVKAFSEPPIDDGFVAFARNLIVRLTQIGKTRTAETYTTALNSFVRFRGKEQDIPLEEVDANLMEGYESWLKLRNVCPNSISFYMRNLRAIYNRAVDKELTVQHYPFRQVYTGIDKTVKRAISARIVRQIRDLDLTFDPSMDYARNIFMFSFYTRGMSFVDMAFLKKKDLQNGILSYRRQKTGQQLFVKWEKPMQEIVDKYDTTGSLYLLPIIRPTGKDERRQYQNAAHLVNTKLKKIGIRLGLTIPLTTYVARHGWASIARSQNIPISIISEAMGHDSETTTRIYLASLDTSVVDRANSLILRSI